MEESRMANRDIVAIGASAGGISALQTLARGFERDLPASVLVTIHLPSQFRSSLDAILSREGPLPATFASDREVLKKGCIYIAPPGQHLLVDGERALLGQGPRENNARPAIDPMMRSAAACCGHRTIGVVLTGTLADGASGLWALSRAAAVTVVQDPSDAAFPEMPLSAMNRVRPDHVVHLAEMPALLNHLVREAAVDPLPAADPARFEVAVAAGRRDNMNDMDGFGQRSVTVCPDCGGTMWELKEGDLMRYRCHVGHAYTAEQLAVALDNGVRDALAIAERVLNERAALVRKLHEDAVNAYRSAVAELWLQRVRDYEHEAKMLKNAMTQLRRFGTQPAKP
jgi:two-component system chemotaxis response regulator CheB